jgi:hypothetical protein
MRVVVPVWNCNRARGEVEPRTLLYMGDDGPACCLCHSRAWVRSGYEGGLAICTDGPCAQSRRDVWRNER